MRYAVLPGICLIMLFCTAPAYAGCMSCVSKTGASYTEQVCEGDSTFDAIRKCGPPDYREEVEERTTGEIRSGTWRHSQYGTVDVSKRKVVKFYYDCGYMRLVRVLTFSGGKLVSVDEGGRGSGEQKCW